YCQERTQLVAELQREVQRLGGKPAQSGSMAGSMHRGWSRLKEAIGAQDDNAILAECERAQESSIEVYEHALRERFPASTKQVISRQFAAIQATRDRIRELEKGHPV